MAVDVEALREAIRAEARRLVDTAKDTVLDKTRQDTPTDQFELVQSLSASETIDDGTVFSASVTATAYYASWVDEGTQQLGAWGGGPVRERPAVNFFAEPMQGRWDEALAEAQ